MDMPGGGRRFEPGSWHVQLSNAISSIARVGRPNAIHQLERDTDADVRWFKVHTVFSFRHTSVSAIDFLAYIVWLVPYERCGEVHIIPRISCSCSHLQFALCQ